MWKNWFSGPFSSTSSKMASGGSLMRCTSVHLIFWFSCFKQGKYTAPHTHRIEDSWKSSILNPQSSILNPQFSVFLASSKHFCPTHVPKLMIVHGCSWLLMSNYEHSWVPVSNHEHSEVTKSSQECSWLLMTTHKETWILMTFAQWSNDHSWELKRSGDHGAMGTN